MLPSSRVSRVRVTAYCYGYFGLPSQRSAISKVLKNLYHNDLPSQKVQWGGVHGGRVVISASQTIKQKVLQGSHPSGANYKYVMCEQFVRMRL